MLIIFDECDKSGKTKLAKMLSSKLNIPYIKLNNISVKENESIKDGISISTHSQLETFTQLYEKGLIKDAILDRFHGSEFVYSKLFNRDYSTEYIESIDKRLSQFNDVFIIRTSCDYMTLINRWKEEKLLDKNQLKKIIGLYEEFYKDTTLKVIEINSSYDIDLSFSFIMGELYKRGIYPDHLRSRRESHDKTMMEIAKTISKRSPDLSRQVGAVLTENGFIVGVGYNGPPSGMCHDEIDIRKEKGFSSGKGLEFSRSIHAEQNAIMQSGLRSRSNGKLELYCTTSPCIHCTRMLLQIGISKIVYINKYDDEMAENMWKESGIEVFQWEL